MEASPEAEARSSNHFRVVHPIAASGGKVHRGGSREVVCRCVRRPGGSRRQRDEDPTLSLTGARQRDAGGGKGGKAGLFAWLRGIIVSRRSDMPRQAAVRFVGKDRGRWSGLLGSDRTRTGVETRCTSSECGHPGSAHPRTGRARGQEGVECWSSSTGCYVNASDVRQLVP